MCGIAGFVDFHNTSDQPLLERMTQTLEHRGPDDVGALLVTHHEAAVGLGHRRLSVIDVSAAGHQPMSYADVSIVFNGEIYNFAEIRKELIDYGDAFTTHSDTEVILHAYTRWGTRCVERFIGMFAFCIFDRVRHEIILFRDRAGVKPLYYYWQDGLFLFGSELKALLAHPRFKKNLNPGGVSGFLRYGYVPTPNAIFLNTYKVKPGHFLSLNLQYKSLREEAYWDVFNVYSMPKRIISEQEAEERLESILTDACRYRMVADVPVGVFLSGGYDSSVVCALLQRDMTTALRTFTIGFHEQEYNEAPFAKNIARYLGTDHTEYYCTKKEAVDILPALPFYFDEPFGDSSAIPTILVSRLARQKVTVALSADGGDETFGGYGSYLTALKYLVFFNRFPSGLRRAVWRILRLVPPRLLSGPIRLYNFESRFKKTLHILAHGDATDVLQTLYSQFVDDEQADLLLGPAFDPVTFYDDADAIDADCNDDVNRMLALDYKTYLLDDILTKVDRAAMSCSLEGREPLLDHRIIEFTAGLPSSLKIRGGVSKYLLKKLAHRLIPARLLERPKMGFGVPVAVWFKEELKEYLYRYLERKRLDREGIFRPDAVVALRDRYLNGGSVAFPKIWFLLMFEMWYERWMENASSPHAV